MHSTKAPDDQATNDDNNDNMYEDALIDSDTERQEEEFYKEMVVYVDQISQLNNNIHFGAAEHSVDCTAEFMNENYDAVVNVAAEVKYPIDPNRIFELYEFAIYDDTFGMLSEFGDEAVECINKLVHEGKKIYVHCGVGISRCPAILIYYLMMHREMMYDDALEMLQTIRPCVKLNPNFEDELRSMQEHLLSLSLL